MLKDVSHIVASLRALSHTEDNCDLESQFVSDHVVGIVSYDANEEKEEWDTHFLLKFQENEGYGEGEYLSDLSAYRAISNCLQGKFDELVRSERTPGERRHGEDCPLQVLDMMRILSTASTEAAEITGDSLYLSDHDPIGKLEESAATFVVIEVVVIEEVQEFELLIDRRTAEVYLIS